jgi:transcriptional regulator with XRE-family HTH domain
MNPVESSKTGVAALPLDDLAPARLGMLLRCARKQQSLSRRSVADRIGASASELRRCERGDATAAPSLITALANCYGEALAAQFASRTPIRLEVDRLVVGTEEIALQTSDADELLGAYIGIVARLRHIKPGEPIALRTEDVAALSTSLGQTSEQIEQRIAELLDCTLRDARSVHSELLRRRLIAPTAGLLATVAIVAGAGCAAGGNTTPAAPPRPTSHAPSAVVETVPSTTHHTAAAPTTSVTATPPRPIDVAGVTAKLPEPETTVVIDIGDATSMRSTTTRPAHVTATTAKKPAQKRPRPPASTTTTPATPPTTTTPTVTDTTAP